VQRQKQAQDEALTQNRRNWQDFVNRRGGSSKGSVKKARTSTTTTTNTEKKSQS